MEPTNGWGQLTESHLIYQHNINMKSTNPSCNLVVEPFARGRHRESVYLMNHP